MTESVISPQIGTITAVKRLLYVTRQCEKIMSPVSFNMMKKALFSVFQKYMELQLVFICIAVEG